MSETYYLIQSIYGDWSRVSTVGERVKQEFLDGTIESILQINKDGTSFRITTKFSHDIGIEIISFEEIAEIEVSDELRFEE